MATTPPAPRAAVPMAHRILVVEDDADILELLGQLLSEEGFGVVPVTDGQQALDALQESAPTEAHWCLVFLDLMLPRVQGLDVLRYISMHCESLPVVAMSASPAHLAEAMRLGARVAVPKPFDILEVVSLAETYCLRG